MGRGDDAAYAVNWKTVLAVDLGIGLAALLVGVVLVVLWNVVVGGAVAALGFVYAVLVLRRIGQWRALRRGAGL